MFNNAEIVIIGAGASGFAAASRLLERGYKNVTILEAKNRIGGRIHTVDFADNVVEMGAQWVHGELNNVVYEFASPHDLLRHEEDVLSNITFVDAKGERIPPKESASVMANYFKISDQLENNTENIAAGTSYGEFVTTKFLEAFNKEPFTSNERLEQFLIWLEKFDNSLQCSDSWNDVSAKYLAEYWPCEGDQLVTWKKNGYKTLFDVLQKNLTTGAEHLNVMGRIQFQKELESIDYTNPDKIVVTTSDGTKYNPKHVIFTPSLGVLKHQHSSIFNPPLPASKQRTIESLEFGTVLKIFLEFPEKWWSDKPETYSLLWSKKEREEFVATNGKSKEWLCDVFFFFPIVKQPRVLASWSIGQSARFSETLSDNQMIDDLHLLLKKCLGKMYKDIPKASKIIRSKWFTDKHTRGCYSYMSLESEKMKVKPKDLAEPITTKDGKPIILFAGEATNEHHYSTVHGAVDSGFREANRLFNYHRQLKSQL